MTPYVCGISTKITYKNVQKKFHIFLPIFCEDGKTGKNASYWPHNGSQTAKTAGREIFPAPPQKSDSVAFKRL
jgi:hypothetical protein